MASCCAAGFSFGLRLSSVFWWFSWWLLTRCGWVCGFVLIGGGFWFDGCKLVCRCGWFVDLLLV